VNFYRILHAPWIATPRSTRWLVAIVLALLVVADVLVWIYGHAARSWILSAILLGIGNGLCWTVLIPNGLVLVLDARRLGLPGIRRDVVWSLPLYAVLSIGVPMLLQLPHGHVPSFGILLVMVAAIGSLYMLLPGYLGLFLCLLPVLNGVMSGVFALPGPTDPRFVPWGAGAALLLALAAAWRWHQLLRGGEVPMRGLRAPTVINFRRSLSMSRSDPLTGASLLRGHPDWLVVQPDLRRVGPQVPNTSLRVALGGIYLPQTIINRFFHSILAVLILAFFGLLLFGITRFDPAAERWVQYVFSRQGFIFAGLIYAVFCLAWVMAVVELLTLRWERSNAELPLLALLPGVGRTGDIKRMLLRAAINRPASRLGLLCLVGLIVAASLHVGRLEELAMLLIALACLGYLVASTLSIFGGHPLPGFGKSLLVISMFVLLSLTLLLPMLWHDWSELSEVRAGDTLGAAWFALALFLLWLGRRGWFGLRQRPHPFLPNGSKG